MRRFLCSSCCSADRASSLFIRIARILCVLIVVLFLRFETSAATFTVTTIADSGAGSLRQAIEDANAAAGDDVVNVTVTGTVLLALPLPTINDNLIINGGSQAGFIIDGQNLVRGLDFFSPNIQVQGSVNNLTIRNAKGSGRGGVNAFRSDITLTNVTLRDCTAGTGGGVSVVEGLLTVSGSIIDNNTSTSPGGGGGGIYFKGHSEILTITNTQIINNDGTGFGSLGGGIYAEVQTGDVIVTGSSVSNNTVPTPANFGLGGGMYLDVRRLDVTSSTVSANAGSGIYLYFGRMTMTDVTVSNNTGSTRGGGIYFDNNASSMDLTNCRITGNSSTNRGGGIFFFDGNFSLINSLIANNTAGDNGGGMFASAPFGLTGTNATITGTRFINNQVTASGTKGGGLYFEGILNMSGSVAANNTLPTSNLEKGGGMYLFLSFGQIENSTFSGNTASESAGIFRAAGVLRISNATIANNFGATRGGGLYDAFDGFSNITTLRNCTITGNSASVSGGGIVSDVGLLTSAINMANVIVSDNTAPVGAEIQTPVMGGGFKTVGVNIIKGATDGTITVFSGSNITGTDPQLLPLATYGGIVATRALGPVSIARNAGINSEALNALFSPLPLTTDARGAGFSRFVGQVDIGAYEERQPGAALLIVTDSGTAGDGICDASCTLRDAITAANLTNAHDEIFFDTSPAGAFLLPATITLAAALPDITRSVTVAGHGQANLFISGGNAVRPFRIDGISLPGIIVNLNNFTIRNGGGVTDGGAIEAVNGATLNASNLTISNNTAANNGVGIVVTSANLNLTNSIVDNNTATNFDGGGVFSQLSNTTITNSRITNNRVATANGTGGGISIRGSQGSFLMTGSTISGNTVSNLNNSYGAGIFTLTSVIVRIENSTISGNSGRYGPGLTNEDGTVRLSNVTIANNISARQGGGILSDAGTTTLRNCTVAGNSAVTSGGGISQFGGTVTIANSIVADNTAPTGADVQNAITLLGANIIESPTGYTATGAGTQINADPMLLALANNGGIVETKLILGPSPALNAGVNAEALDTQSFAPAAALATDARGVGYLRFVNAVDIGAVEVQLPSAAAVSVGGRVTVGRDVGIRNARVSITDSSGVTRVANTGSFGYYSFDNVAVGGTYILTVQSKRYAFGQPTLVIVVNDEAGDVNFVADDPVQLKR